MGTFNFILQPPGRGVSSWGLGYKTLKKEYSENFWVSEHNDELGEWHMREDIEGLPNSTLNSIYCLIYHFHLAVSELYAFNNKVVILNRVLS